MIIHEILPERRYSHARIYTDASFRNIHGTGWGFLAVAAVLESGACRTLLHIGCVLCSVWHPEKRYRVDSNTAELLAAVLGIHIIERLIAPHGTIHAHTDYLPLPAIRGGISPRMREGPRGHLWATLFAKSRQSQPCSLTFSYAKGDEIDPPHYLANQLAIRTLPSKSWTTYYKPARHRDVFVSHYDAPHDGLLQSSRKAGFHAIPPISLDLPF